MAPPPLAPKTPPTSTTHLDGATAKLGSCGAMVYDHTVSTRCVSSSQVLQPQVLDGLACTPNAAAHGAYATPARFGMGEDGATLNQMNCEREHLTDLRSNSLSCEEPRSVFVSPLAPGPGPGSSNGRPSPEPSRCSSGRKSCGPGPDMEPRGSNHMLGPELTLRPSHNSKQLEQLQDRREGREPHDLVFDAFASCGTSSDCRISGPSESCQALA